MKNKPINNESDLIKVWSRKYKVDFDNSIVKLPDGKTCKLTEIATLFYLLHMKGEANVAQQLLSIGKEYYLNMFPAVPPTSSFLDEKRTAAEAMEDDYIKTMIGGA